MGALFDDHPAAKSDVPLGKWRTLRDFKYG